jgi:hypothetical protein
MHLVPKWMFAFSLAIAPLVASAQDTTLDYQGYVMGGTSTIYIGPEPAPGQGGLPFSQLVSAPTSTIAAFDATLTYSGSLAQNNLVIDSYEVNLTADNGQNYEIQNLLEGYGTPNSAFASQGYNYIPLTGTNSCSYAGGFGACITLTTSGDAVTGAAINLSTEANHGTNFDVTIGPSGDAFSYGVYGVDSISILGANDCSTQAFLAGPFVGPSHICDLNVSNPTAGVWTTVPPTPVPEIDPTSAGSGITLLLGSLLVLQGRRQKGSVRE